jgi:single-strand DNA-binding protein
MKAVCIAGRLGKAAELRRLQDGTPVLSFSVAVDEGWGDKKRTIWFDCSMFGKRGETLKDMLPKGKEVTVSGDLSTREYEGKTYLTVRVNEVTLQGGRSDDDRQERGNSRPQTEQRGGGYADDMNDDLPFAAEWR